ncbi:MAG: cryptochrome/photolyase family protein [Phycisphaerae bacterium]|nr:cryptochrome/photolyase family protein [Phycisphaerae bacterium]
MPTLAVRGPVRRLAIVLGDQLNPHAEAMTHLHKSRDAILMMEVSEESTHVPSHKQRTVLFLSAMRHFAMDLARRGHRVRYIRLEDPENTQSFSGEIERAVRDLKPEHLLCTHPGEWRVKNLIEDATRAARVPLETRPDRHFLVDLEDFDAWMADRRQPVMEHFYREQRRRLGVLMDESSRPIGGVWNFDEDNRGVFRRVPKVPKPCSPRPDAITKAVTQLVQERFPNNPGSLQSFRWPVTRTQALRALDDFAENRLAEFGTYQDAMWANEPFLYHSLLSASLNLKLLDPRECVAKALAACESGQAPLNSVEGFIRQIIGWREFIRGIYWHEGASYDSRNELDQHGTLPEFYWTGRTEMVCMSQAIGQVLACGYGHHIQRLMVTGNFALIAGVDPRLISDWYLAMYVDAVDWVTLPNTLGMVMHADGGVVGTKPYAASGKYIERMSNYCRNCPFDPAKRVGASACPFSTFYWDFLNRNRRRFRGNRRMSMMLRNVDRLTDEERAAISAWANQRRREFGI